MFCAFSYVFASFSQYLRRRLDDDSFDSNDTDQVLERVYPPRTVSEASKLFLSMACACMSLSSSVSSHFVVGNCIVESCVSRTCVPFAQD